MRELFLTPPRAKIDPVIPQNKPVYRVLDEKGFFGPDDTLHPEGEIIVLHDEPNINMEPMNDLAKDRLRIVMKKLNESSKHVADANGRYFAPQTQSVDDMLSNATEDARRIKSLSNPDGVAIMGAKLDSSKRIESAFPEEVPESGAKSANKRAKIETITA